MTHLDEIARLKAIIEEQQLELEQRDAKLVKQKQMITHLEHQVDVLVQALLQARKKNFGRSSEVTPTIDGQLHLFETDNELIKELAKKEKEISVKPYTRTPRKAGVRAEMLASLPHEVEICTIAADDSCTLCGGSLKVIGKEVVRTEVEFIPSKVIVKQIVREVAKCVVCGTGENEHLKDHFQKAKISTGLLAHSIATPSLVAHIMYQKFALGTPFKRQELDYYRMGLVLPRANMARWTIRCGEDWLTPIYDRIHEKLLQCETLHMDETRIQVNKEPGRKASSQSFMWVMQSGESEEINATFFHYTTSRCTNEATQLLKGFQGYLTTDAYIAYKKLDSIKNVFCWAHCRRYFIDSIPLDSKGKEIPGSKGAEGREHINLLFKLERKISQCSYEEKKNKRQVASRAILDVFWSWVDETAAKPTMNEKLTVALNYVKNNRVYLETFLEDGRLELSNNRCEAHIKPFATARRSWLFADTPKGARANAILYTLVESAKANELNIYEYLKHLLKTMPELDFHNHKEVLDDLLPWSKELPSECSLKQIKNKCFK